MHKLVGSEKILKYLSQENNCVDGMDSSLPRSLSFKPFAIN